MKISLPEPKFNDNKSLRECIWERESIRAFKEKEVELEKLSALLWAVQGKKGRKRTVPSAGATYPLEIHVLIKNKGLFHYDIQRHELELIKEERNLSRSLSEAALNQYFIEEAPLNIIISAKYERTCNRYGKRGIRYVYIEIGHAAQNLHLMATSLNLGSVPVGAFQDNLVKSVLELPLDLDPLYIIPIGYPK
ncbi:MAG: SagB/ThcOx family dehydrogenase [Promethearchaeota archaeon]